MLNEQEECCDKPGVTHFHFGEDTGIACEDHCAFGRPSAVDEHPVGPDCSMPNAIWQEYTATFDDVDTRWSTCIVPFELGLTTAVNVALPEPALAGAPA
jgi:hypothetical protein